jgi:hypothetical protein
VHFFKSFLKKIVVYFPKTTILIFLEFINSYDVKKSHRYVRALYRISYFVKPKFTQTLTVMSDLDSNKFTYKSLDEARFEKVKTTDVYQLTEDNFINLLKPEIRILNFKNATILSHSDAIRLNDIVYYQKANRPTFAMTIPLDSDFLSFDSVSNEVTLLRYEKIRSFSRGYSLCGVHAGAWAHFIISYLPKIIIINEFKLDSDFFIFVPKNIHSHHLALLDFVLKDNPYRSYLQIILVDTDEEIECEDLYYCNDIGYLCDHSLYMHPADTCISRYGSKLIASVSHKLNQKVIPSSKPKRIYIGRGPVRNLTNSNEVEAFFVSNGFEIVHPHLLSFEEKINLFGNASHICGAVSSGFANLIFSNKSVKVLGFFNFARCFDPFIEGLNYAGDLGHSIKFLTGYESPSLDLNASFYIPLSRIQECCDSINYFED